MCGRYTLTRPGEALDQLLGDDVDIDEELLAPRYNVAPTHTVPVARPRHDTEAIEVVPMSWGFLGHKDRLLINARCETVTEKSSFREAFDERRCLIPADGFYEWRRSGKARNAFHFHHPDRSAFFFAGLWQERRFTKDAERCVILTTRANSTVASVHDRMPVILGRSTGDRWLERDATCLEELFEPAPEAEITGTPVGPLVNKVENDSPELILEERHVENLSLF